MDRSSELYDKLMQVQWMLQGRRRRSRIEAGPLADPTSGQGRILALLKLKDGISTKDLSHVLGMRVSSLNEMLSKMEKAGYVTRRPSEEDRRVMLVELTQQGREADQNDSAPTSLFSCLSDEEQERFGEYLDRLIAAMEASMGKDARANFERARKRRDELFTHMHDGREEFDPEGGVPGFFGGFGRFGGFEGHGDHHRSQGHRGCGCGRGARNDEDDRSDKQDGQA